METFFEKDSLSVNKLTNWKIPYIFIAELQTLLKATSFLLERQIIKALEKQWKSSYYRIEQVKSNYAGSAQGPTKVNILFLAWNSSRSLEYRSKLNAFYCGSRRRKKHICNLVATNSEDQGDKMTQSLNSLSHSCR